MSKMSELNWQTREARWGEEECPGFEGDRFGGQSVGAGSYAQRCAEHEARMQRDAENYRASTEARQRMVRSIIDQRARREASRQRGIRGWR